MCRNWSEDRDRSILELIGMTSGEAEHRVKMAEEKQQVDEFAYDGRFDDPLTELASAAFVGGGVRDHGSAKPEASIPSSGKRPEHYPDRILVSVKTPPDTDDSDESFYSCPGTPKNPPGEDVEAQSAYIPPNPTDSGGTALAFHGPHHICYPTPAPESVQLTSYLYAYRKRKGSAPSMLSSTLETMPQQFSKFSRTRHWRDFEEQIQSTLGSAESSFNASSSSSNKPGMDWSPPTSLETSFNEDVGPITRPTGPNYPRLDIVAEGIDEMKFSGDEESPYNGDCDGDMTDIDDPRVGYKQLRPLANSSERGSASQSLRNRPLSRNRQRKASATPNPNNTREEEEEKDEDEEEVALQKMGKEFFDDEYQPPCNPGTPSFGSLGRGHEIHRMNGRATGSGSGAGEWDNINYALELVKEVQEPWDDEDEFGEVGTSFGEAFSGESFIVIVFLYYLASYVYPYQIYLK